MDGGTGKRPEKRPQQEINNATSQRNQKESADTRNSACRPAIATLIGAGLTAPPAHAQVWKFWSNIGADGTVDEKDTKIYETAGPRMQIKNNAPNRAKLNVRYAVTWNDDEGYRTENTDFYWYVRFRDNGPDARVKLMLKSYDHLSGEVETLMTFDSDELPPSDDYQFEPLRSDEPSFSFDWNSKAYFVEAVISRTSAQGNPGLGSMVIWAEDNE